MVIHIGYSEIVLRSCFTTRGACIRILSAPLELCYTVDRLTTLCVIQQPNKSNLINLVFDNRKIVGTILLCTLKSRRVEYG